MWPERGELVEELLHRSKKATGNRGEVPGGFSSKALCLTPAPKASASGHKRSQDRSKDPQGITRDDDTEDSQGRQPLPRRKRNRAEQELKDRKCKREEEHGEGAHRSQRAGVTRKEKEEKKKRGRRKLSLRCFNRVPSLIHMRHCLQSVLFASKPSNLQPLLTSQVPWIHLKLLKQLGHALLVEILAASAFADQSLP